MDVEVLNHQGYKEFEVCFGAVRNNTSNWVYVRCLMRSVSLQIAKSLAPTVLVSIEFASHGSSKIIARADNFSLYPSRITSS